MGDPHSDPEPVAVVQLDYYQSGSSAWEAVVRSIAAIAAVITAISAVFDTPHFLLRIINGAVGNWLFTFTGAYLCVTGFLLVLEILLVAGCIASRRFKGFGRNLVVWSSAAIVIFALAQMLIAQAAYYFEIGMNGASRDLFFSLVMEGFSSFARECFVPVALWYFFRRTEVRELFRR